MNRITRILLAGTALAATATLYLLPGNDWAAAQMAPTPCADCDDKNAGPGNGSGFFFAFECDATTGESQHIVTARNRTNAPVNAHVNSDWRVIPAGGREMWTLPTPAYDPGLPYAMWIEWGMSDLNGRIIIPNRLQPFDCPCGQPATTTSSPPSSAVTTAPPVTSAPATTVPGTPTTPAPSSVPGTTQPFRLPDTGADAGPVLWAGLALVVIGVGVVVVMRFVPEGDHDEERGR